jgi:hypothetical protein
MEIGSSLSNDIARVFKDGQRCKSLIQQLTDNDKLTLLENHWMPPTGFKYPHTLKGGKRPQKVYLGQQHISGATYDCFKFSPELNGVLHIPCVLFASEASINDRNKTTKLGRLVEEPLTKYNRLTGKDGNLTAHLKNEYPKSSQALADGFLRSLQDNTTVAMAIDDQHMQNVKDSRERLLPIVKTIILCARLGIAYRGSSGKEDRTDFEQPVVKYRMAISKHC